MKKAVSILLTLAMLVGMLTVGTVSVSAADDHVHIFDKNYDCIECGKHFSIDDYQLGDNVGWSKTLSFQGAKSIIVDVVYDAESWYGFPGFEITGEFSTEKPSYLVGSKPYTFTVEGSTVTFQGTQDHLEGTNLIVKNITPIYADEDEDEGSGFSDNYVRLEYIQNTNGQYIKTGYNAGANVTVSLDLEITDWNGEWSGIFGSRSGSHSDNTFVASHNGSKNELCTEIGSKQYTYPGINPSERIVRTLSGTSNFKGTGIELTLFGINNNGTCDTKGAAIYKLYSCKITDNGEVKRDFVPAQRKSDGAIGLYDLQNGNFYESASENAFELPKTTDSVFSDNYVRLEYIQNTNGQYIKTGYKAGANVTVSMNLEITDWKVWGSSIFGSRSSFHSGNTFAVSQNGSRNELWTEIGSYQYTYPATNPNERVVRTLSGTSNFKGDGIELTLFGINENGNCDSKGAAIYKLYSCKITDGAKVVRDFVPAQRKSDGMNGLYDLQNGVFYPSADGNSFYGVVVAASLPTTATNYTSDATIELEADQDIAGYIQVSNGATVNLYMNGHTLTYTNTAANSMFHLTGGTLNIYGDGTIKSAGNSNPAQGGFCHIDGAKGASKLTIASGSTVNIQGFKASSAAGGVYINHGGSFTMNGGTIKNCTSESDAGGVFIANGSSFTMNGGFISGCSAEDNGGAIDLEGGSFTMNGGELQNNTALHSGGAVLVCNDTGSSTFTMNDGKIYNNKTTAVCKTTAYYWGGGGVAVFGGSTFNMKAGDIFYNTSANEGGGVLVYDHHGVATFNMSGGSVRDNNASKGYNADVIALGTSARFTRTGGKVGKVSVPAQGDRDHTFNRDGICTICGETYDFDRSYSGKISFQGCQKILIEMYGKETEYYGNVCINVAWDEATWKGREKLLWTEMSIASPSQYILDSDAVLIEFDEYSELYKWGGGQRAGEGLVVDLIGWRVFPIYEDTKKTVAPTCTEEGNINYTYHGTTKSVETIEATGHRFGNKPNKIIAPDECSPSKALGSNMGYTIRYCNDCDYSEKVDYVPPAHTYGLTGKCTRCGEEFSVGAYHSPNNSSGYHKRIVFSGAESITVHFSDIRTLDYIVVSDKNRNECGKASTFWNNLNNGSCTVPGDTVYIQANCNGGFIVDSVTPNYPTSGSIDIDNRGMLLSLFESISAGKSWSGVTFNLTSDIDLAGVNLNDYWKAGTNKPFCGAFNGNNHTIKGVTDTGGSYGGLFHVLGKGAVVKNLTLENVNINSTGDAGALATTTTDRVTVSNVNVKSGTVVGKKSVGGIIGWLQKGADISSCSNGATVSGGNNCGGIIGTLGGSEAVNIKNCKNTGSVTGANAAGGIIGWMDNGNTSHNFSGCQNGGAITQTSTADERHGAGGIAGVIKGGCNFTESKNTGTINAYYSAGGIIGFVDTNSNQTLYKCTNSGTITAKYNCAGGITGQTYGGGDYRNCINEKAVSGGKYAGGIIGWNQDDAINFSGSSNSGVISGAQDSGGIIGWFGGSNAYNFAGCTNTNSVTGTQTAGGIVGCASNGNKAHIFTKCHNSGNITQTKKGEKFAAGGIAGVVRGGCDFSESVNTGVIKAYYSAGGIIGFVDTHSDQTLYKSKNTGSVTAEVNCAGGIVGQSYGGGDYRYCENGGTISGKFAGGVLGWNEDDSINFSYSVNNGEVEATKHAGGIAGHLGNRDQDRQYIGENCINRSRITADDCAGGIVGNLESDANSTNRHLFTRCQNSGTIRSWNNTAGGIIGACWGFGDFMWSSNSGDVYAKKNAGGIIGWNQDDAIDLRYTQNYGKINGGERAGQIYGYSGGEVTGGTGDMHGSASTGSVLSEGNLWIIIAVAVLAIGGVATLFIVKKKKKPIAANGASTDDE